MIITNKINIFPSRIIDVAVSFETFANRDVSYSSTLQRSFSDRNWCTIAIASDSVGLVCPHLIANGLMPTWPSRSIHVGCSVS